MGGLPGSCLRGLALLAPPSLHPRPSQKDVPPAACRPLLCRSPPHLLDQQGCGWSWAPGRTVLGPTATGGLLRTRPRGVPPLRRQGRLRPGTLFQTNAQKQRPQQGCWSPLGSSETLTLQREPHQDLQGGEDPGVSSLPSPMGSCPTLRPYAVSSQASARYLAGGSRCLRSGHCSLGQLSLQLLHAGLAVGSCGQQGVRARWAADSCQGPRLNGAPLGQPATL